VFFLSFIIIQLIEYFIWKNINNKFYNHIFSFIALIVIILQPVASLMLISDIKIRNVLIMIYAMLCIPFSLYNFQKRDIYIYTNVSPDGHLHWNFLKTNVLIRSIWLFFFLFSLVFEKQWYGAGIAIITLLYSYYNYYNDRTIWSMWCWIINSVMIYHASYLLLYLPLQEKIGTCLQSL
jgi:hypothetical protein